MTYSQEMAKLLPALRDRYEPEDFIDIKDDLREAESYDDLPDDIKEIIDEISGSNDSEAVQETLTKVKSGNPYRQSGGRFGTGPGKGSGVADELSDEQVEKYSGMANKEDPDYYRADHLERIAKDLGNNGKPGTADKLPEGAIELHRTWTAKERDAYLKDANPRLSIGIYGSGLYFSNSKEAISSYDRGVWSKAFLDPSAKIIGNRELNGKMFDQRDRWTSRFTEELQANNKIKDKIKRAEDGFKLQQRQLAIKRLFTDSGIYASLLGYDAIQSTDGEFVVLNRGKVIFLPEDK